MAHAAIFTAGIFLLVVLGRLILTGINLMRLMLAMLHNSSLTVPAPELHVN